jgi:hypothetical protein
MHMTDARDQRLRAIADLIRARPIASQDELAEGLAALGVAVTQATISRDLEQLGAVKVRRDNRLVYALPDQRQPGDGPDLASVVRDWVRSVDAPRLSASRGRGARRNRPARGRRHHLRRRHDLHCRPGSQAGAGICPTDEKPALIDRPPVFPGPDDAWFAHAIRQWTSS